MKLVAAAIITIVVVGVGYFIYTQITRAGKVPVTVAVAPGDAEILVGGERIGTGTAYLVPNKEYEIKVHKDGFSDHTQKRFIAEGDTIAVTLAPVSAEAQKWAEENQDAYRAVEAVGGLAASEEGEKFVEENPIVELLPYDSLLFNIGYRADTGDPSGKSIIISIEAEQGARNGAIQQIHELGYDPTQYKIEFNDYKNPFEL